MAPSGEAELLGLAKGGDRPAFERLVRPYLAMLFAYSRAIAGDYHAAHDIVQQALLIAYRKLNLFFPEADFGTWLRAIARREALDARKKKARPALVTLEAIEAFYQDPGPPEESPRRAALGECLRGLGGRMGDVVRGHYFDGLHVGAIAERVGMTAAAVKQLMYRARLALRDCVRKRLQAEASG